MGELGQTDNIFVVYPSFTGGNHLSNLIGLCKNVEPTWLKDKELFKKYYEIIMLFVDVVALKTKKI